MVGGIRCHNLSWIHTEQRIQIDSKSVLLSFLFTGVSPESGRKRRNKDSSIDATFLKAYSTALRTLQLTEPFRNAIEDPVLELIAKIACQAEVQGARKAAAELFVCCAEQPAVTKKEYVARALLATPLLSSPEALQLISSALKSRPDATSIFLQDPQHFSMDPKLSFSWIASTAIFVTALSTPLPKEATSEDILPASLFDESGLEKTLVHANELMRLCSLQVTLAAVRRVAQVTADVSKLNAFAAGLPSVNTLTAAVKLALADGGLASALALEILYLYLICNASALTESRVDIAKLIFSDPSLLSNTSLESTTFRLTTSKLLKITEHIATITPMHIFAGRSSDQRLSRFGQILRAYSQNRDSFHRYHLRETTRHLLQVTNMFPGSSAIELDLWIDAVPTATEETLTIIDEMICEAFRKPFLLVDDVVRAAKGGAWRQFLSASNLPFSPLLSAAMRRIAKLNDRSDNASRKAVAYLCRIVENSLKVQIESRPLCWLVVDILGSIDHLIVRFAKLLLRDVSMLAPKQDKIMDDDAQKQLFSSFVVGKLIDEGSRGEISVLATSTSSVAKLAQVPPNLAVGKVLFELSTIRLLYSGNTSRYEKTGYEIFHKK